MTSPLPLTERVDAWLVLHRRRVLGVLLFAAVFVRLMVGMELAGGPLVRIHELVPASDNSFFATWSQHLAEVDWLQREPLHPMAPWMRRVARQVMREHPELPLQLGLAKDATYEPEPMAVRLWDHWLGGATYFQEPLYPYLMALTRVVAGPSAWSVFLWQGLLGVGTLWLTYLLGRRLLGETVGVLAAVLGLGYAPFVVHEFALLRDSLIVFATLALLWTFVEALDRGGWRWALFGALSGLSLLLKVPFIFFVALALVGALVLRRCKVRDVALTLGCMGLALLPALLRNAAVGVPLFKLNGSGTAMLALFHVEDALPSQFIISKHYAAILAQADGHLLPSLLAAIRTHASLMGYVSLCVQKLVSTVHGVEIPNNVDVGIFQNASPTLDALPLPFWLLGLLGTVGTFITRSRWRQVWPLYVGILAGVPTLLLASVLTRYRLPMVAVLLPLAAAGLLGLLEWARARRWGALVVTGVLAAPYVLWATQEQRSPDRESLAQYYRRTGAAAAALDAEFSALHFQECLRWDALPDCHLGWGQWLLQQERTEEGLAHVREAAALAPADSALRQQSEKLLNAHGGP